MLRLRKRKLLSKEAKKDRMVYNLVILGTLILLFGYSIAFCSVSTSLKFEGSGKVKSTVPDALPNGPYRYRDRYFYGEGDVRVATGGAYVTRLSDMINVMKTDSSGDYVIYMKSTYYRDTQEETVNVVNKYVCIYLDEFDEFVYMFPFYIVDGSFTINVSGSSGLLNITCKNSNNFSRSLFYCSMSTLTLNGNIAIGDLRSNTTEKDMSLIYMQKGTLNLTKTEISGVETTNNIIGFNRSTLNLDSVNIHDNTFTANGKYAVSEVYGYDSETKNITGSSVIYNNKYGSAQKNVYCGDVNYVFDGTGLTSSCKIGVYYDDTTPSSSNPVTIFKNITRSAITPGTNIIRDLTSYSVAYGDSNSTTTIVLK